MMINRWIAGHPIAQQVAVVLGDDGSTSAWNNKTRLCLFVSQKTDSGLAAWSTLMMFDVVIKEFPGISHEPKGTHAAS